MSVSRKAARAPVKPDSIALPGRLDAGAAQDLLDTLRVAGEGGRVMLDGAAV
jgi:hypothetical protein